MHNSLVTMDNCLVTVNDFLLLCSIVLVPLDVQITLRSVRRSIIFVHGKGSF
jgi:hypothetical protein